MNEFDIIRLAYRSGYGMIKYCRCKKCAEIRKKHKNDGTYQKWLKESKLLNKLGLNNWVWESGRG